MNSPPPNDDPDLLPVDSSSSSSFATTDDDWNHRRRRGRVTEIVPGLWMGGWTAVWEIRHIPRAWTVISILTCSQLSELVRRCLQEMNDNNNNNNNNNASSDSSSQSNTGSSDTTTRSAAATVVHHLEWALPDQVPADFISPRLVEILQHMDCAILGRADHDDMPSLSSLSSSLPATTTNTPALPTTACLVHCARGVSRSAAVCAAWLLSSSQRRITLADALNCLCQAKPDICPNLGFIAGLLALEQTHGDVSSAMVRMRRRVR